MGKLVMAVSGGLTAFVLAITAGAIYTFRSQSSTPKTSASSSSNVTTLEMSSMLSPAEVVNIAPQDAASRAAEFLKRTDLYSVEMVDLQGAPTYKVTFSSGDVVFVSTSGVVLYSVAPPSTTVITVTTGGGGGGGNRPHGGGGSGGGGEDGDGEDEHEGDHDGGDD